MKQKSMANNKKVIAPFNFQAKLIHFAFLKKKFHELLLAQVQMYIVQTFKFNDYFSIWYCTDSKWC